MKEYLLSKNRKALFEHRLVEKFTAGIVLKGHEVKAVREGKASFEGSYVQIIGGIPKIINLFIGPYSKQSSQFDEYDARATRALLLNKSEILSINKQLSQKGYTAVPLALISRNGNIKLEFGVVKGLKEYERKSVVKERQIKRDLEIEAKGRMSW